MKLSNRSSTLLGFEESYRLVEQAIESGEWLSLNSDSIAGLHNQLNCVSIEKHYPFHYFT